MRLMVWPRESGGSAARWLAKRVGSGERRRRISRYCGSGRGRGHAIGLALDVQSVT